MERGPLKVLFHTWHNLQHSYGIVSAFLLIHLQLNYGPNGKIKKNGIDIYVEEAPYYNPDWNNKKKLVYSDEYNEILTSFKQYNGEKIDLIYRQMYPYNINPSISESIPICVFYTSEFATLDIGYFECATPPDLKIMDDNYIIEFLKHFKNIFFTSPSIWSSYGMKKYTDRDRIITHGVDSSVFFKHTKNRTEIRKKYNVKESDILMINTGAMTKNKGIMLFLEALNILVNKMNKKQFKLMLKGTGDLYQTRDFLQIYFQELIQSGKLSLIDLNYLLDNNHIIFTDKTLSFERINDLYNASDLYISPYLCEGFALTPLECLSSGNNVLVPRTGSTKEYMEDIYNNGGNEFIYYVDSQVGQDQSGKCQNIIKIEDIVNTILKAEPTLKIQKNYEQMQRYIQKDYSWDKVSELLYQYFNDIITRYH